MARGSKPFRRGNRWAGVIDIGDDPLTGKRRQQWVSGGTAKEVEGKLTEIADKVRRRQHVAPMSLTLADYLPEWLDARPDTELRPQTRDLYRSIIEQHLVPGLGKKKLQSLEARTIMIWYNAKRRAGLGEPRLFTIHNVLNSALKQAVRWNYIARNPCDDVTRPKPATKEMVVWSREQAFAFIAATAADRLGIAWHLALRTTMRRGELLGLRWADVDLTARVARIRAQVPTWDGKAWIWPPTKTARSTRDVPLPHPLVAALRDHRRRQTERRLAVGPEWTDLDLVVDRGDGQPWTPTTVSWEFAHACTRLGMPRISLHGLRHTAITLLVNDGMPQHEAGRIAGHTSITMTDHYTHPDFTHLQEHVDRMDKQSG